MLLSESAKRAEGTFKYPIRRHSPSFWHALAFMIVKGVPEHMPPLEIIGNVAENTADKSGGNPDDNLSEHLHRSLRISPRLSETMSTYTSRASSSLSQLSSLPSSISSASTRLETLANEVEPSPIIYGHVRNLRGILFSNHFPTSTNPIQSLAHPHLGSLASRYLASHGYRAEDVNLIIDAYRRSHTNEQYITFLSSRGMAVNEVKFLLSLIDLRNQQNTSTIDGTTY